MLVSNFDQLRWAKKKSNSKVKVTGLKMMVPWKDYITRNIPVKFQISSIQSSKVIGNSKVSDKMRVQKQYSPDLWSLGHKNTNTNTVVLIKTRLVLAIWNFNQKIFSSNLYITKLMRICALFQISSWTDSNLFFHLLCQWVTRFMNYGNHFTLLSCLVTKSCCNLIGYYNLW